MKRFSMMVAVALVLSGIALTSHAPPAHAATCTPAWRTVQSKGLSVIDHFVFVGFGSVSLLRDGCGNLQAQVIGVGEGRAATAGSLTITNVATNTVIYTSTNLQSHGLVTGIYSPTFAGYGGVGITVTGSLTEPTYG
ncbi:MAG: hypothetical protein H0X24_17125, partial [Ktedonobacterales bacterium]|nr:hypothetical protein [Ktedonobacterales bacterium]